MRSLAVSGLGIEELDAFTGSFGSIGVDKFCPTDVSSPRCFRSVRRLDLSLSHSVGDVLDDSLDDSSDDSLEDALEKRLENNGLDDSSKPSVEKSQGYCNTLCDFVTLCPALQHLGLHWYTLTYKTKPTAPLTAQQNFLAHIAQQCPLPTLHSISLRGIHTSQAPLLVLAAKSPLRSVELDNTSIAATDTFRPFFDIITPNLDTVRYSNLWEGEISIDFDFEFAESSEVRKEWIGEGREARRPVKYYQSRVQPSGEIEVVRGMRKQRREYGPPRRV